MGILKFHRDVLRALTELRNSVHIIGENMATQAGIDALDAQAKATNAKLDTIKTQVAALVAAQQSGQPLDLTALTTDLGITQADVDAISTEIPVAPVTPAP